VPAARATLVENAAVTAFSVAFHGITKSSEAAARSMLRLLLPLLGNHWRIADAATSDVVLLDADSLEQLNLAGTARESALYIVFDGSGPPPANTFCVIHRPLNSARTIEVLHKAQAELEKRRGGMGATTTLPPQGTEVADSERGIRTSMRTATRWVLQDQSRAVTVLTLGESKIFSTLPGHGFTTRMRASELADLIRANAPVRLLNLTDDEQAALVARKRVFEPPAKLEWIYWLTGSNGELRPELGVSKPYRLRKWPDFSRLPHYRADVRMASLLKAEALTVGELATRADVRLETACNFVNACFALGLLGSAKPRAAAEASGAPNPGAPDKREAETLEKKSGLMGSLRSALGLNRRPSGTPTRKS
jgi:hypothetical protein